MGISRDQIYGVVIMVASVIGIVAYGWFIYSAPIITLQVTAFIAVTALLGILAWIGWTMATTPPPASIEEPETTISETKPEEEKAKKD